MHELTEKLIAEETRAWTVQDKIITDWLKEKVDLLSGKQFQVGYGSYMISEILGIKEQSLEEKLRKELAYKYQALSPEIVQPYALAEIAKQYFKDHPEELE